MANSKLDYSLILESNIWQHCLVIWRILWNNSITYPVFFYRVSKFQDLEDFEIMLKKVEQDTISVGRMIKIFLLFYLQGDVDMEEDWVRTFHDLDSWYSPSSQDMET